MKITTILKLLKDKALLSNEIVSGILLFFISFASIQITANLITSGYEPNQGFIIRPILLFLLPLIAGLLTIANGILFNLPFVILPNMMITILTIVYGRLYLGYSLINVFFSVFLGTMMFFVFSFFISDKNWKQWIPEPLVRAFPFVMGGALVFFGLFKSGFLAALNSNQTATNIGDSISMVESQIPVFLGYLWNPLTILVFVGICLFLFFQKLYPKYSLLITFLVITFIGIWIPLHWNNFPIKGKITEFTPFGMFGVKKEGFILLFSNFSSTLSKSLETFLLIIAKSIGLLKLSLLVFITLTFQNLFLIKSFDTINHDKQKTVSKTDKKGQTTVEEPIKNLPYRKLTTMNAFSGILGIFSNLTAFSYAQESAVFGFTKAKTGLSAVFCGILLVLSSVLCFSGIFTSQAGTPLLFIIVGLSLAYSHLKDIHFDSLAQWFPGLIFLLISIITLNPVEGLVIGIIFYVLITSLDNFFSRKEIVKIHSVLWISFAMCLLFVFSQLYIQP